MTTLPGEDHFNVGGDTLVVVKAEGTIDLFHMPFCHYN